MKLSQNRYKTLFVDELILCIERNASTQLFEDVVYFRGRQPSVQTLLAFAVGIEAFGDVADAGAVCLVGIGEGKRLKAKCLVVAWSIFECSSCGK